MKKIEQKIEITKILKENRDKGFLEFCNNNSLKYISDITSAKILQFANQKGVGYGKIKYLISKIEDTDKIVRESNKKSIVIDKLESLNLLKEKINNVIHVQSYLKYCELEKKIILNDIVDEITNDFINIPNIGIGKRKQIKEDIKKLIEEKEKIEELIEGFNINIKEMWFEKVKNKKVKDIKKIFGVEEKFDELDNKLFKEIQNTKLKKYEVNVNSKIQFIKFVNKFNKLQDINEIIRKSLGCVSEKDFKILTKRYILGETLGAIAKEKELTRERIRQIIKKVSEKINCILINSNLIESIYINFSENKYINISDVFEIIEEDIMIGFKIFIEQNKEIIFEDMEIIDVFNSEELLSLNTKILEILDREFILDEKIDQLHEIYRQCGFNQIESYKVEKYLIKLGYKKRGKIFTLETISLARGYELTLKYGLDGAINLEKEEKMFKDIYKEIFDEDISNKGIRSIEARMADCSEIICIGNKEYIHIDNFEIDIRAIDLIDICTDEMLVKLKITTAQDVLKENREKLELYGINNKYKLYGIIKYYMEEKYITGKGNSMSIAYSEESQMMKKSKEELIREYIEKNEGKIKGEELLDHFKWKKNKLEDTISKSELIIKIAKYITLKDSKEITEEIRKEIKVLIEGSLKRYGIVSTGYIYTKGMLDTKIYELFKKYNVTSGEDLASLVKMIDTRLKGHTNILIIDGDSIKTINDLMINRFKGTYKKEELKEFLSELGYKEAGIGNIFKKLIAEKEYYYISSSEITYKDNIKSIDEKVKSEINKFIEEEFKDSEYLVINNIPRLRRVLTQRTDSREFRWEPEMVNCLKDDEKYTLIKRKYSDYIYGTDRVILVKKGSNINSFEELVKYIVQKEYTGIKHVDSIYKFLCEKGVIYNNKKGGIMPYEILNSVLFNIDEVGRFEIKE
ncbi:hypothetical protein [uncultured Clostridium sp.]|uniref:hypothetical protein n=1 Tax=uncultured Clostridium sp. TaxID=59620 RepID=UPI0026067C9C|nr:hypothetical protein [uncultured Clostridium sp.]